MVQRILSVFMLSLCITGLSLAEVRDGKLYDTGAELTAPSEKAPAALAEMADFVGDWDVEVEIFAAGEEPVRSNGTARVTYMNRGHGLMERSRIPNFNGKGHDLASMAFLTVTQAGVWSYGQGDTWTESVSIASGAFEDQRLVMHDARRSGGSIGLALLRRTLGPTEEGGFVYTAESSQDFGKTWSISQKRTYRRHQGEGEFFAVRDDVGMAAPDRPEEAGQFDFLLGEYDTKRWLWTPQRVLRWPDVTTAVFVLDGYGILEFSWNDLDPSLPDAATSILRLYNRSMRRWESLYLTNRSNAPLHFGGVQEGDRIVLHPFAAQTAGNNLSQWIFYDVRPDAYRWKGLSSFDRGNSYALTWGIDFQRRGVEAPEASEAPPTEVHTMAADGVVVFGDHYRSSWPGARTVLLFHQAGGDARGEYTNIARRLVKEGYEVIAWDARSGGERFGQSNRTVVAQAAAELPGYCAAYGDLEAALQYAKTYAGGAPIYAVGSSYSAALVIRLAAEHGKDLAGVAAFSPASGRAMGDCDTAKWLPEVEDTPVLAFRPAREAELETVKSQTQQLGEKGIEVFVAEDAAHGASMLEADRNEGDVEATWARFLAFLANPSGEETTQ